MTTRSGSAYRAPVVTAPADIGRNGMRTRAAALALLVPLVLLTLAACVGDPTVSRYNPCVVEASVECQHHRYATAP